MIMLSRDYPPLFGAPVIRMVDERVFTLRYFARCMDCGFCADQCCSYGVDIDWATMEILRSLGPAFERFVGVPQSGWFAPQIVRDDEFPSGAHGRTAAVNGKCVFAGRSDRGCRIHAWCLEHGLDYHLYKPMVSILFPLSFEHGALVPAPEAVDATLACSGAGVPLYDGVRDELSYFFGSGLVAALDDLRSAARPESPPAAGARARR